MNKYIVDIESITVDADNQPMAMDKAQSTFSKDNRIAKVTIMKQCPYCKEWLRYWKMGTHLRSECTMYKSERSTE